MYDQNYRNLKARHACLSFFVFFFSILSVCLFLKHDFLAWHAFDFKRVVVCSVLSAILLSYLIKVAIFDRRISISLDLIIFLPIISVFVFQFILFDRFNYFGFEGIMFALFFMSFPLASSLLIKYEATECAIQGFLSALALAAFFYAALSVVDYLIWASDGSRSLVSVIPSGFPNIRFWSHVATWVLPLFPLFSIIDPFKDRYIWKVILTLTAGVWWWIAFMSMAQGTLASIATASVITVLIFGKIIKGWCQALCLQILWGLVLFVLLSIVIPEFFLGRVEPTQTSAANVSIRTLQWREALAMSFENFPFGMGGQSWLIHEPITKEYAVANLPIVAHPHNMYLMWAAEYGWFALVGFAVLVVVAFHRLYKTHVRVAEVSIEKRLILSAFTTSVGAACIHAVVSSVFLMPASMLVGMIVLTCFWALISEGTPTGIWGSFGRSELRVGPFLGGLMLLISILFLSSFLNNVLRYQKDMYADKTCFNETIKNINLPRFWLHGYYPRDRLGLVCKE